MLQAVEWVCKLTWLKQKRRGWSLPRPFAVYEVSHDQTGFGVERFKALSYRGPGLLILILADLPLTFEPFNREFDADDAFGDGFDVIGRSIADLPRRGG